MPDRFSLSFDNRRFRLVVLLGLLLGLIGILWIASASIKPFLVALGLAFLMEPAVVWLSKLPIRKRQLPRWLCVVVIYIALFCLVTGLLIWTAQGLRATVRNAGPAMTEVLQKTRLWLGEPDDAEELGLGDPPKVSSTPAQPFDVDVTADRMTITPRRKVWRAFKDEESDRVVILFDPDAPPPTEDKAKEKEKGKASLTSTPGSGPLWDNQALSRYFRANLSNYLAWLGHQVQQHLNDLVGLATKAIRGLVVIIFNLVLCFMIAAFISSDGPNIVSFLRDLVPTTHRASYEDLTGRINRGLAGVIRGQLTICLVNGTLTGIMLFILVKPVFAFPLTLMVTALSLIPIFGTVLSSIPCILFAMIAPGMWDLGPLGSGIVMLVWIIAVHMLEANYLNPKIIGSHAEIHPVLVVFALVVGGHSYGFVGALLGVAAMSVVQNVVIFCHDKLMEAHAKEQAQMEMAGGTSDPPPSTNEPGHGPSF